LNARGGPGTDQQLVTVLHEGSRYDVVGRNREADWFELRLAGGEMAWAAGEWLQLVPAAQPSRQPTATRPGPASASATPIPAPPAAPESRRSLEVSFINPHYECEHRTYFFQSKPEKDAAGQVWSNRSFQVDLYIRNRSSQPVLPPWRPARWTITDGVRDHVLVSSWEWPDHNGELYKQPAIRPGEIAGWTFRTVQVQANQWVKAVEYEWNGERYRQEFDLGPYHQGYNYRACP
jgi:hypothetical protein